MEKIRDCDNRLACIADPATGLIEFCYKKAKTRTHIPIGAVFTIERDGIITNIKRVSTLAFEVESHKIAHAA